MKIFFDTNVILDVVEDRCQANSIRSIIERFSQDPWTRIYCSYLSIANTAYILRKRTHQELCQIIKDICKYCNVISCDDMQIRDAISNESPDFEDALQIMCAESKQCDVILSRNPDHFRQFTEIPVFSPEEFVSFGIKD